MAVRWTRRTRVPAVSGALITASFLAGSSLVGGGSPAAADVLMVAAALVAGAPVAAQAVRALTARVVSIDLLVSVAAVGALVVGEYWEAAAVTTLFAVGHALEAATLDRTRAALAALVAVAPDVAVVLRGDEQVEVPAASVAPGEVVLVKNGAKVPVDGRVVAGGGALDESSITGESLAVEKAPGDRVFAGTVSRGGVLRVEATGVGEDTTLARIIARVEEAQDARARTARLVDRFSGWYTPAVVVLALVVGLATRDVVLALTILVIACPGALVISIPVAAVAGIGRAARDGVLVKGGDHLERVARVDVVAVDKTGTLTTGRPRLTDVVVLAPGTDRDDVLRWAAAAEVASEHPLARTVLDAASAAGLATPGLPERTEPVPGQGVVAHVTGHRVLVGNPTLLATHGLTDTRADEAAHALAAVGRTPVLVAVDDEVVGVLGVADEVRPHAARMVALLRAAGVRRVVMLTGDAPLVAHAVARDTGVDEVRAGLLPEDKLAAVVELQRDGHVVAMLGDGVNDAPALATADVGVAMGAAGSAVAVETADLALMGDDLRKLPAAIRLARRTVATMRQNVAVALVTVALLLTGVLVGGVTMAVGMLVHEASVLLVVANAMRLLRADDRPRVRRARRLTIVGARDSATALPPHAGRTAHERADDHARGPRGRLDDRAART